MKLEWMTKKVWAEIIEHDFHDSDIDDINHLRWTSKILCIDYRDVCIKEDTNYFVIVNKKLYVNSHNAIFYFEFIHGTKGDFAVDMSIKYNRYIFCVDISIKHRIINKDINILIIPFAI